jgi:hypothetical protein
MTIGIGVLATSPEGRDNKILPDTVILMADTMGSYEDVDSHARLHKLFMFPHSGMYACAAGQIDRAGEVLSSIDKFLQRTPKPDRSFGRIMKTISEVCYGYKHEKFVAHEFPKLRLPPQPIDPITMTPELDAKIQKQWDEFSLGCDLVIGAFCNHKGACLIHVNGTTLDVENMTMPGFASVGISSDVAGFWLCRRRQTFGDLPLRSAYHAYEAKLMAESSAHVNEHLDILVATDEKFWFCTSHTSGHPYEKHAEINIENLKEMWKRYGPQDTSRVGEPENKNPGG